MDIRWKRNRTEGSETVRELKEAGQAQEQQEAAGVQEENAPQQPVKGEKEKRMGKGKALRAMAAFIAFALGISLVLVNGVGTAVNLASSRNARQDLKDAFSSDYQQTEQFRCEMSGYLETLITMAVGGPLSGYNSDYWEEAVSWSSDPRRMYEEEMEYGYTYVNPSYEIAQDDIWEDQGLSSQHSGLEEAKAIMAQEAEREAQDYHQRHQADKNILYIIEYNGEVKYTNAEGTSLSGPKERLPEGYNFLMYFDGKKVDILKDGKQVDVYGSGQYTEDSPWYVPGYSNFSIDEKTENARITIAAAQTPMVYVKGEYAGSGASYRSNQLYWMTQDLEVRREGYIHKAGWTIVGVVLLAVYFLLRRDKQAADRFIARGTRHIWFECKLLAAALVILTPIVTAMNLWGYSLENLYYMWYEDGFGISDIISMNHMAADGPAALLILWVLYLVVNDLRYNEKTWSHTLWGKLGELATGQGLALPLEKRIVRQYGWVMATGLVTVLAVLLIGVYIFVQYSWSEGLGCFLGAGALLIAGVCVPAWSYGRKNRLLAEDMGALARQIAGVRSGNLTKPLEFAHTSEFEVVSEDLNNIQHGMQEALEEQTRSERMKVELITNVSHDLKTPLTSIITYADLLAAEEGLPEHVRDYVRIMNNKANRLKTMVQDVFEVSKAAVGQLPVQLEKLDYGKLIRQTLADMEERIQESPITLRADLPQEPIMIIADGRRLYRVFQNLIQNALAYSLEGSRIYVSLKADGRQGTASVKNTSRMELAEDMDFTERFARGDESRTDGGSGLGLSIASSFTEACGGRLTVAPIADLFVVTVEFDQLPADRTGEEYTVGPEDRETKAQAEQEETAEEQEEK